MLATFAVCYLKLVIVSLYVTANLCQSDFDADVGAYSRADNGEDCHDNLKVN